MVEDDNYADDLAEFMFGRSYHQRYRITIIDVIRDGFRYIKLLPKVIIGLFDRTLIKDLLNMRKQENVKSLSMTNLKKLIKVNVAMFKMMQEINSKEDID